MGVRLEAAPPFFLQDQVRILICGRPVFSGAIFVLLLCYWLCNTPLNISFSEV